MEGASVECKQVILGLPVRLGDGLFRGLGGLFWSILQGIGSMISPATAGEMELPKTPAAGAIGFR